MRAVPLLLGLAIGAACGAQPSAPSAPLAPPAPIEDGAVARADVGVVDAGLEPVGERSHSLPRPGERLCVTRRKTFRELEPLITDEYVDAEGRVTLIVARGGAFARQPFVRMDYDEHGRLVAIERQSPGGHMDLAARYAYEGDSPLLSRVTQLVNGRAREHSYHYQGKRLTSTGPGTAEELAPWHTEARRLPERLPFAGTVRIESEGSPVRVEASYDEKGRLSWWKARDGSKPSPEQLSAQYFKYDAKGRLIETARDVAGYGRSVITDTWVDGRRSETKLVTPHDTERSVHSYDAAGRLEKTVTHSASGAAIGEETVAYQCP